MDTLDLAIHGTAHDAPGGLPHLARKMGVGEQMLRNKVCPTTDSHKLNLREALAMMIHTGDVRILECLARELGCAVQRRAPSASASIVQAVLVADAEHGDVARTVLDAIADGKLTESERAACLREIAQAQDALSALAGVLHASPTFLRGAL